MKKYLEIGKVLFKAQLSWRFDIAFNMIFTIIKILFAYIVWGAILMNILRLQDLRSIRC